MMKAKCFNKIIAMSLLSAGCLIISQGAESKAVGKGISSRDAFNRRTIFRKHTSENRVIGKNKDGRPIRSFSGAKFNNLDEIGERNKLMVQIREDLIETKGEVSRNVLYYKLLNYEPDLMTKNEDGTRTYKHIDKSNDIKITITTDGTSDLKNVRVRSKGLIHNLNLVDYKYSLNEYTSKNDKSKAQSPID